MKRNTSATLTAVVGFLVFVEFTSGVLQGYYTPMLTDIARHLNIHDADVNWLEGSQLMLSALVVPAFAKLGDLVGHKRMLLISTGLTAAASLALPFADSFWVFLAAWTLQGFYVVWLPLQIALIWSRSQGQPGRSITTAKAAGILIAALELGAIGGALAGGALVDVLPIQTVLLVPALIVVACFFVILFGVADSGPARGGRFDTVGMILISFALLLFTGGLSLLRLNGASSLLSWAVVLLGLLLVIPFVLWELRQDEPLIEVRFFRSPTLAPVFVTAGLFGVSVLGAQAPLSTFVRTDPQVYGYGLGVTGFITSVLIGIYLISMVAGALIFPMVARRIGTRRTLVGASLLVGVGYLMFVPFHDSYLQVLTNMMIAGIGSGALVAALPTAAAVAAPEKHTTMATGMTNSTKTLGGAVASAVFGIVLMQSVASSAGVDGAVGGTAGSFSGYLTVWLVCGITALVSALVLALVVPKQAFSDVS